MSFHPSASLYDFKSFVDFLTFGSCFFDGFISFAFHQIRMVDAHQVSPGCTKLFVCGVLGDSECGISFLQFTCVFRL